MQQCLFITLRPDTLDDDTYPYSSHLVEHIDNPMFDGYRFHGDERGTQREGVWRDQPLRQNHLHLYQRTICGEIEKRKKKLSAMDPEIL